MNIIAIGILALLAVSLMISSKHFRLLMATCAAVIVILALGLLGVVEIPVLSAWTARQEGAADGAPSPTQSIWKMLTQSPGVSIQDMVEAASAKVLAEVDRTGDGTEIPPDELQQTAAPGEPSIADLANTPAPNGYLVRVKLAGSDTEQRVNVGAHIASNVERYLDWFQANSDAPGVDRLRPEDLYLHPRYGLLKFQKLGVDEKGVLLIRQVFDDAFHQHVRDRGRQLVTKDRLKKTAYICLWAAASLTVLFGLLKFRQARRVSRPAGDYLSASGVSMM